VDSFEYALGLFAILMGLALADIAISFHRLLRHGRSIKWDARPVLAAALVVVEIVRMWFAQWSIREVDLTLSFPFYLALFIQNMLLFLLAAACLPDDPGPDCELGSFYERNARYFWGAYAGFQACFFGLWLYVGGTVATVGEATLFDWFRVVVPLALYLTLVFVRSRTLDHLAPVAMILFYLTAYWTMTLAVSAGPQTAG
jgi:hypothetical protein